MRASLQRIVLLTPQRLPRYCIRCATPESLFRNIYPALSAFQHRVYSVVVKDSETKEDTLGAESTGTVSDDPDITTTESLEAQEPPPSLTPASESWSPSTQPRTKESWHFRLAETKISSATRAQELVTMMSQTSLRKKLHWYPPLHGVNPAYDIALLYLNRDRRQKMETIKRLEERIAREREGISH
jgi:hypothetical protein